MCGILIFTSHQNETGAPNLTFFSVKYQVQLLLACVGFWVGVILCNKKLTNFLFHHEKGAD